MSRGATRASPHAAHAAPHRAEGVRVRRGRRGRRVGAGGRDGAAQRGAPRDPPGRGPLPWPRAVEIAASIAEMLAVAHRRGIAHRDLTADNVMLTTAGVKIIDFGLALPFAHPSAGRDQQAPAWDVYALGVLLYHMLTGRSPHAPGARLLQAAPTPVVLTPGLPRSVAELCRKCMAKRPDERPESAEVALSLWAEFATDWQQSGVFTESYGTRSGHGS
ncbi:protein kinase domain-containing protein [Dactylosporangium darangshiense]|uniref:protein kinase domain-containing protein n=1 Tax=Dactylosporangium darangshiense TaxID=579108 RepID=UPI003643CF71